jgi:flagellin-specific chaperone FliS
MENSENIEKAKEAIGRVVKISFKELRNTITQEDLDLRSQIASNLLDEYNSGELFQVLVDKYTLAYEKVSSATVSNINDVVSST